MESTGTRVRRKLLPSRARAKANTNPWFSVLVDRMAGRPQQRLWNEDPHFTVLLKLTFEAHAVYDHLVQQQEKPEDQILKHKFSIEWLIEELFVVIRGYDRWTRGRARLATVLDIKYKLQEYVNNTLEHPSEERARLFEENHQQFGQLINQLENLFGP